MSLFLGAAGLPHPPERLGGPGPGGGEAGGHSVHHGRRRGYVKPALWLPLVPNGTGSIIKAAALVFFAYLGFDVISVTAEESRHPERDVPFAIIGSLTLCSLIYLAVTLVLVGLAPFRGIDVNAPFSTAFRQAGLSLCR